MKAKYIIFSEAGHVESGNSLPVEDQVQFGGDEAISRAKYLEACQKCQKHYSTEISAVNASSYLNQDVSGFYWWVILLRLPADGELLPAPDLSAVGQKIKTARNNFENSSTIMGLWKCKR
jgi:hypothetical protein